MKELGLYLGCAIPTEQYGYEMSIRETMPEFDIKLVDLENFSCCGAPLRSINLMMQMYLSARNIAICESKNLDMYTPCPQCHLSLTETINRLKNSDKLREKIVKKLRDDEGLKYTGNLDVYHTLDLLHDEIGINSIKKKVKKPINWNIACHYGCHTVRYSDIKRPDRAEQPNKMEEIIKAIGGKTQDYSEKLNCCGAPLMITHKDSALTKAGEKIKAIQDRNFDAISIVCPFGGRMLDSKQQKASDTIGEKLNTPVFYLTQLIGLAMNKKENKLGLNLNLSYNKILG
jgi:heterodisulfide reductase subunit B2